VKSILRSVTEKRSSNDSSRSTRCRTRHAMRDIQWAHSFSGIAVRSLDITRRVLRRASCYGLPES